MEKATDIYSRRGAENAERFTGIRRSDFSREHRQFAVKTAPTNNQKTLCLCASVVNHPFLLFSTSVYILKTNNVIFTKITAGLHFDQLEGDLADIFQAVFLTQGDIG